MKALVLILGLVLSGPVAAQTLSASSGGAYDGYASNALRCMADAPGDAVAQTGCIEAAVQDCQSKAGVYEACLDALRQAFDAAALRVEARALAPCETSLDAACAVTVRGQALIGAGAQLSAEDWVDALTEGQ